MNSNLSDINGWLVGDNDSELDSEVKEMKSLENGLVGNLLVGTLNIGLGWKRKL